MFTLHVNLESFIFNPNPNIHLFFFRRRLLNLTSNCSGRTWKLIFPPVKLCTDNGVMAAWAGIEKLELGLSDEIEGQVVVD